MKKTLFALIACASLIMPMITKTQNPFGGVATPFEQARQVNQRENAWSLLGAAAFTMASTGVALGGHAYRESIISATAPYLTQSGARTLTYAGIGFGCIGALAGTFSASVNVWNLWRQRNNGF